MTKKPRQKTRPIILLLLFALTTNLPAQPTISPADLENFQCTLETTKTRFAFEGLETLDGTLFDPATVQGKYVIVNLWATWCPYCAKEKPSYQKLYEQYNGEFAFVSISVGEEPATVRDYMTKEGYTFPVVLNRDNAMRAQYAPRIPRTYILDPDGYILATIQDNRETAPAGVAEDAKRPQRRGARE